MGFEAIGAEELQKFFGESPSRLARAAPEMLAEGAKPIIAAQRAAVASMGLVSTGALSGSVGLYGKYSTRAVVSPLGENPSRRRNALVGFVHEYGVKGSGKRPNFVLKKIPWMDAGAKAGMDAAIAAMEKVWEKYEQVD